MNKELFLTDTFMAIYNYFKLVTSVVYILKYSSGIYGTLPGQSKVIRSVVKH